MNVENIIEEELIEVEVELEDNSDILRDCAGKCGQKILSFSLPSTDNWGDNTEGAFCLECRAKLVASGSLK